MTGSRFAATSSQTELRLVNTARSSLEELLLDFEDFLRQRHLAQWAPDSPEAMEVRRVPPRFKQERAIRSSPSDRSDRSDLTDQTDRATPTDQIPACPLCGKTMVLRTAKTGRKSGTQFWGCSTYPACKGATPL